MKVPKAFFATFLLAIFPASAWCQSIQVTGVKETVDGVEISIETDMATPFEVMAGISLSGQLPDDVWIGNNAKYTVRSATQILTVKPESRGKKLPAGRYDAEVNFYPRWGAEKSPSATKAIKKEVSSIKEFSLKGSGENAGKAAARENNQRWVMENTAIGDPFSLSKFERKLGESVSSTVTNRNGIIVAHYFADSDITIFENTLKGTLVTWKLGKHSAL